MARVHPCVDRMVGGFEGEDEQALFVGVDAGGSRLVVVDDAQVGGVESGLRHGANGPRGGEEIREAEDGVAAEARPALQPHPRLGDHAERAFGPDDEAVRAGAGARAGQAARLHHAGRGDRAEAFDEIVDMGVERGEMAARARRDPAAQGRELEALRVVPDGEPVRLQRRLDRGPTDPASDARGAARRVDLEHAVEMTQIEADRAGVAVAHLPARRRRRPRSRRRTE